MKKPVLIFFVFACSFAKLIAQPTLTSANSAIKPGDNYINQPAFTTGVPVFSGGANQSWNYSNLIDSGFAVGFETVLSSATPFADSFPGSNVCVKTAGDSVFSYLTSSSASLLANGLATNTGTVLRYDPYRTFLTYPFTYNSFYTGDVSVQLPGYSGVFSGNDSITGEGYGSLSIPGKNYSNVLRVRYIENLSFTVDSGLFKVTTQIRTVNDSYISPDTRIPVLSDAQAHTTITTIIFGTSIVTTRDTRSIEYLKLFVLPVTFQSFKADVKNKEIDLQWRTAQEVNTDHFIVQRSLSGRDFEDIASVKATGSASGSAYSFTDKSFAGNSVPPVVYYRIQSVDKDGKLLLSDIAVVRGSTAIMVKVYPNPASNFIRISSPDASVAELVSIYDAKGSLVQQWRNYSISQPIAIASLAKGNYTVKVTMGGKTTSASVIKQ